MTAASLYAFLAALVVALVCFIIKHGEDRKFKRAKRMDEEQRTMWSEMS